ncbi:MAG: TetR/AcrR family transcriptional regulator [Bacteroidota bacterium]|nr:TetR/AcrR family transcriptional regulator [Bacteroidota bacterium]
MEIKEKIIYGSVDLFMKFGFRSITMDDIAKHLSISKKTIYLFFKDKDELISTVTELHLQQEQKEIEEVHLEANNPIEELYLITKCMRKNLSDINPTVLYDLQKFHKQAWEKFLIFKEAVIGKAIKDILDKGIQAGYFRKEIDIEILSKLRQEQVQMGFDDRIFPPDQYDFKIVQMQLFDHFVHGITTQKGQELLDQYFNNSKE